MSVFLNHISGPHIFFAYALAKMKHCDYRSYSYHDIFVSSENVPPFFLNEQLRKYFDHRFPLPQLVPKVLDREFVKSLNFTDQFPLDCKEISKETTRDDFLVAIMTYLRQGWPDRLDRRFRDVSSHHQELEEVEGCVLFQDRVIIPDVLKPQVLKMLHRNHNGMSKMKQLARRTVYWFGMNKDVEEYVKCCRACNQMTPVFSFTYKMLHRAVCLATRVVACYYVVVCMVVCSVRLVTQLFDLFSYHSHM